MASLEVRQKVESLSRILRLPNTSSPVNSLAGSSLAGSGLASSDLAGSSLASSPFPRELEAFHHRLSHAREIFAKVPPEKKSKVAAQLARRILRPNLPTPPLARSEAHLLADMIRTFDVKGEVINELRPKVQQLVCQTVAGGAESSVDCLIELLGDSFKRSRDLAEARNHQILKNPAARRFLHNALTIEDLAALSIGERNKLRAQARHFCNDSEFINACREIFNSALKEPLFSILEFHRLDSISGFQLLRTGRTVISAFDSINAIMNEVRMEELSRGSFQRLSLRLITLGTLMHVNDEVGKGLLGMISARHQNKFNTLIGRGIELRGSVQSIQDLQYLFGDKNFLPPEQVVTAASGYLSDLLEKEGSANFWWIKRALHLFPNESHEAILKDPQLQESADRALVRFARQAIVDSDRLAALGDESSKSQELFISVRDSNLAFLAIARTLKCSGFTGFIKDPGGTLENPNLRLITTLMKDPHYPPGFAIPAEASSAIEPDQISALGNGISFRTILTLRLKSLRTMDSAHGKIIPELEISHQSIERDYLERIQRYLKKIEKAASGDGDLDDVTRVKRQLYYGSVLSDLLLSPVANRSFFYLTSPELYRIGIQLASFSIPKLENN